MKMRAYLALLIISTLFAPVAAQQFPSGYIIDNVRQTYIDSALIILPNSPPESTYTNLNGYFTFGPDYLSGDANGSGDVNGLDVVYLVAYFKGGPEIPEPLLRADANGSCEVNGLDVTYLVAYLKGGSQPIYCIPRFFKIKSPSAMPLSSIANNKKIKDLEDVVLTENSIPMIIQAPGYVEYHTSLDTTQTLEYGITPVEIGNDSLFNMTDYYDIFGETVGKYDFESMTGNFMLFLNNTGSQGLTQAEIDTIIAVFYDNIEDMTRKADGGSWLTANNIDVVVGDMWDYQLPDAYLTLCFADRDMPAVGSNGHVTNGDTIYANWASFNVGFDRKTVNSELGDGMLTEEQEKYYADLITVFDPQDATLNLSDADKICFYLQGNRRIGTYFARTISGPDTTYTEYDPEFVQPIAPGFSEPTVYSSNGKVPEILYPASHGLP